MQVPSELGQFSFSVVITVGGVKCRSVVCTEKTEDDTEREAQLLEWRLTLTEERNAVMVPSAGSGIPGAPAEWYGTWQQVYLLAF